jgi:hypothetical protein
MRKNIFTIAISFLMAVSLLLSGCGLVNTTVNQFNNGKALYLQANTDFSNFKLCVDTEVNNVNSTFALYSMYLNAEITKVQQYRAAQAAFQANQNAQVPTSTTQDGQQVVDFNKLGDSAASPSTYAGNATQGMGGLTIAVNAVQEAQIPNIPPEVFTTSLDAVQVANNHIFQCGKDWNASVNAYNTWRGQVTGRVIGDLANYFGIDTMPIMLPQYQGTFTGSGGIPTPVIPAQPTP